MLRSLLMIILAGLLPSSLLSQDGGSAPKADSSERRSFSNEIGLGVHSLYLWWDLGHGSPLQSRWVFQGSYKKQLEHFTLRTGIGVGATYTHDIHPDLEPYYPDKGWSYQRLILNAGIEKAIWRIKDGYEMNFGLDLMHISRWGTFIGDQAFSVLYGAGLTWVNQFFISDRSSISMEIGMAYGRVNRFNNANWKWGGDFNRMGVLSYHYHFK